MKPKYKTVISSRAEVLDAQVNQHLEEGYELAGTQYNRGDQFVQPMIKRGEGKRFEKSDKPVENKSNEGANKVEQK